MSKETTTAMSESPLLGRGKGEAHEHDRKIALNAYTSACNKLLRLFCDKHEYDYDPLCWVGGDTGGVAMIGDYSVDMETIITDIKMEAPEEEFLKWYDYCLEAHDLHITAPNYRSWLMGCPRIPEEGLQRLRDIRAQLFEETERVKKEYGGF